MVSLFKMDIVSAAAAAAYLPAAHLHRSHQSTFLLRGDGGRRGPRLLFYVSCGAVLCAVKLQVKYLPRVRCCCFSRRIIRAKNVSTVRRKKFCNAGAGVWSK